MREIEGVKQMKFGGSNAVKSGTLEIVTTHAMINELKIEAEDNLSNEWSDGEKTVLAIIVYEEPVYLSRINEIMDTDCGHHVISLQERGLVKRKSNKCMVTPFFFGLFGIEDSSKLPSLDNKDDMSSRNDSKSENVEFSYFDSLIEESAVSFDYQWLR
ncbi:MAG: SMC-Scp complex subunit ScpB [Oligoflexia bacterium]|nr:SMC-Scp complex subunit ScpB [Oligoflexia bacterium]